MFFKKLNYRALTKYMVSDDNQKNMLIDLAIAYELSGNQLCIVTVGLEYGLSLKQARMVLDLTREYQFTDNQMRILVTACLSGFADIRLKAFSRIVSDYKLSDNQMYIVFVAYYLGYTNSLVELLIELVEKEKLSDDQMYALCLAYSLSSEQLHILKNVTEEFNLTGLEVLEWLKQIVFENGDLEMPCYTDGKQISYIK